MRAPLVCATVVLLGLTACGHDATVKLSSSTPAPAAQMATCGSEDQAFPVDVLTGPAPAESVVFGDAPGAALRAFLDAGGDPGGGGFEWTDGEWLVLHRADDFVQYGYRSGRGFAYANADLKSSAWTVSNYGTCHPVVVGAFPWRVYGSLDRSAAYLTISYEPLKSCDEVVPTHAEVVVTETDSEVGILLHLTPVEPQPEQSGPAACLAFGATPVQKRVDLKAPLGDRTLLDYGTVGHTPPAA